MKRELLLSTLILTSPIAQISFAQAKEMRAAILEQIYRGEEKVLLSDYFGTNEGQRVRLRVKLHKNDLHVHEPNRIKPELSGSAEVIDENGNTVDSLEAEEGDFIFDLIHSDAYSSKYQAYSCSSTLRCSSSVRMVIEFLNESQDAVYVTMPVPYNTKAQSDTLWLLMK